MAMDIKAPLSKYEQVIKTTVDLTKIEKSVELLKKSSINYEFRTTFTPDLSLQDIESIGKCIKGAKNFSLQNYAEDNVKKGNITNFPHKPSVVKQGFEIIKLYVPNARLKGMSY